MVAPFQRPQPIVESNRDPRHSASQMNSAVARITGMNRAIVTPKSELAEQAPPPAPLQQQYAQQQNHQSPPPQPPPMRHGLTKWDYTEVDMQEANEFGQRNRGPESKVYGRGSDQARDNKARDQQMPKKTAKARPYGTKEQDDEEDTVGKTQPEGRQMQGNEVNEGSITHVNGLSMDVFREMAGMTESYSIEASQQYYAEQTGAVQLPTKQATSYHKVPAGYGDQEGQPMQSMTPKEYGRDGSDAEMTLDQAVAMLKKEGMDPDYLWSRFLGENNLSIPIVEMLCDEAMMNEDEAMAEELMQLEDAFDVFFENSITDAYGAEFAEGLMSAFRSKLAGKDKPGAAPKQAMGTDITPKGSGGVSTPNLAVRKDAKATAKLPPAAGGSPMPKTLKLKPIGGKIPKKAGSGPQLPPHLLKRAQGAGGGAGGGTIESMNFEADDDGDGNPQMPWEKRDVFAGLDAKYGGSKDASAAV